ncbi:MAG: hydrogenase maturation nickel metallochaperone HypA [Planctomycetes bacterium]|nr:hydrogenase maturation nickel metallochaperone HypA [Planctomycetota bacterium]
MQRRGREGPVHELSVMNQVADSIIRLAKEKQAIKIESVHIQVGELTFLVNDQLEFAWEIYTRDLGPPLEGAVLTLERIQARGSCPACRYSGPLKVVEFPDSHFSTPVLDCPECREVVEVTEGRDLIIRDIKLQVPDVEGVIEDV